MTEYVLGTTDHELERLTLQHEVWRPILDAFLDRLAIEPGWRCLDLGCGPGLLAADLLQRVGPDGRVEGVDASPRWIAHVTARMRAEGWSGMEVRQGEIENVTLEPEAYDLVTMRWVLSFLPDPKAALERIVAALRPGGVLAVIDYNHEGVSLFPPSAGFDAVVRATRELYRTSGGDTWIMGRIPALFRAAGLEMSLLHPMVISGGPGSPAFRWADAFFPFHTDGMVAAGVLTAAERETFLREWDERKHDPDALFFSPIVVGAAGRRAQA